MDEAKPRPASRRARLLSRAIAGLAATFAGLSVLLVYGGFDRLDRYAVEHLMPDFHPRTDDHGRLPEIAGLFRPFSLHTEWWEKVLGLALYPASVLVSFVVLTVACTLLWRGGQRSAAVVWGCSWFLANGIELILKLSLSRPELYAETATGTVHVWGFDHAFPSGHTLRAVMLVGLVWLVWRQATPLVVGWAALVPPLLVIAGHHVPADVIGGLVFGLFVVATIYLVMALPATGRRPGRAS